LAAYIPDEKVLEVKNVADIYEVISESVLLKKSGRNFLGLCPFHSEKTPSFTVSPAKGIFHCFGCGTGGNVFSFLMKHHGMTFPEAVKNLAERYGVDLPVKEMTTAQRMQMSERESILKLNKTVMEFFQKGLLSGPSGEIGRKYLEKRGLSDEVIRTFKLGYIKDGWDNLIRFLRERKISRNIVMKSGLVISKENNRYYDRFRNRIIFPILDASGQVIGFGGRVLDDSLPKYLNSPDSPVYNKSRSLYGLYTARQACRESGTVYIVEGYFDQIALHQHGIKNAVASLGTALTTEHVRLLKGYASKMVLVYDSDAAGIKAATRSIDVFMKEDADARILILPEGYDPDSYVFENGKDSFIDMAGKALGLIPFLMESSVKKHGLSVEGRLRIISDMVEPLMSVKDSVARSLYVKSLSERTGIDEVAVLRKVGEISNKGRAGFRERIPGSTGVGEGLPNPEVTESGVNESEWSSIEKQIVTIMLQFPDIIPDIRDRNVLENFESRLLKSIGQHILKNNESGDVDVSDLIESVQGENERRIITSLAIGDEVWVLSGCKAIVDRYLDRRMRSADTLVQKIKAAEESNDQELLLELLNKKQEQARKGTIQPGVAGGKS
jgi:DNA primase